MVRLCMKVADREARKVLVMVIVIKHVNYIAIKVGKYLNIKEVIRYQRVILIHRIRSIHECALAITPRSTFH